MPTNFHQKPPRDLLNAASGALQKINAQRAAFIAARDRFEADTTRNRGYIAEKVEEARKAAHDACLDPQREVFESARIAERQQTRWQDTLLILSHQRYSSDPAAHSAIAQRTMTEMAMMSPELLRSTAEIAHEKGDLPTLYFAILTGRKHHAGEFSYPLDEVKVQEQTEALKILKDVIAISGHSDLAMNDMALNPKKGAGKLEMAHRAEPDGVKSRHDFTQENRHLAPGEELDSDLGTPVKAEA